MKKILLSTATISLLLFSCGEVNYDKNSKDIDQADGVIEDNSIVDENTVNKEIEETSEKDLFYSEDGKFKIDFFGNNPKASTEMVPTEVGNIEMSMFMYEKSATEAYMVAYNDYPSEMVKNSSVDDLLDGAKNGSSSSLGISTFDIDEDLKIEGNPGRHFKGNNGSYYAEYKLFLKGNRLYQIALIRDGSYNTPERTEAFFGSFKLVDDKE